MKLLLFSCFSIITAINIIDLRENQIAIIRLGKMKIKVGHLKLINKIDLSKIEEILELTSNINFNKETEL